MPKEYQMLPTKDEWKRDLGLRMGIIGNRKSPNPPMIRLGKLIDLYHSSNEPAARDELMFHIYMQIMYINKNLKKPDKLGGALTSGQEEAVIALYDHVGNRMADYLNVKNAMDLKKAIAEHYGRSVDEHDQKSDRDAVDANGMQYYTTAGQRRQFKLSFRSGKAYKKGYQADGTPNLTVYDTAAAGDDIESGGSLYVMDAKGHIFVSGKEGDQALKHSSFLAGEPVLAAGTIRFNNGQLIWISGRSGHYRPTVAQIVTALERFSSYGVKMDRVTVYRENFNEQFKTVSPRWFEGCPAKDLLKLRKWPGDNVNPNSMHIAAD